MTIDNAIAALVTSSPYPSVDPPDSSGSSRTSIIAA